MRLVLAGLMLGLMAAISALQGSTPVPAEARAALLLGFLLLLGFQFGELAAPLRLPRITGYLLAGMLCGPSLLAVIDRPVLENLGLIDELALVLIAFAAGAELRTRNLMRSLRGVVAVTLSQSLLVFLVVGLVFWLLGSSLGLEPGPGPALVAFIALVATATSPATTVAVIAEVRACGRLTDLVLGSTVLKDILVLVGFSLLATLAWENSGAVTASPAGALQAVGLSLLLGLGAGMVLVGLLRLLRSNYLLLVVASALVLLHLAHSLGLNDLLLAMSAGFVASNFSSRGEAFRRGLEAAGAPVFLIFFCLAGAGLELERLPRFLPAVLVFVLVRALASWAGTWLGARLAAEGPAVRRLAWTGFLGQAGVSLGLAALVRDLAGPAGGTMADLVVGAIIANQVLGPILFRWALVRSGEADAGRGQGGGSASGG